MQRHFTATALIVHNNKFLLMWHKRLNSWMPPGGHMDPNELPVQTAIRECKEETGLDVIAVDTWDSDYFADAPHEGQMQQRPYATLLENIPASKERNEPAHQHMDFLFVMHLKDANQSMQLAEAEGTELRWFTAEDIIQIPQNQIFENVRAVALEVLDRL